MAQDEDPDFKPQYSKKKKFLKKNLLKSFWIYYFFTWILSEALSQNCFPDSRNASTGFLTLLLSHECTLDCFKGCVDVQHCDC
jgi:hypothetical protein